MHENISQVQNRIRSLDAYRGFIMISLAAKGFGLAATAQLHLKTEPSSSLWEALRYQFSHVQWVGCSYWDLIQPSFMFMVGISAAFSYAKRKKSGHSYFQMFRHAFWRALSLIILGVFLISNSKDTTTWSLMNVLTQIGLGYTFLFLLWNRNTRIQSISVITILLSTWLLYVLYPSSGLTPVNGSEQVGVPQNWASQHLDGIPSAWHKNANVGHATDLWLLNQFPRMTPFLYNGGGYQTINFIPSLATMILGLLCGDLLRSGWSSQKKLCILILAGLTGLILGGILQKIGICPIIKRIWTPAWVVFSTGWCCLILSVFYGLVDILKWHRWTFPLVVVGANSIAVYAMGMLLAPWTSTTLKTHLGQNVFQMFGLAWEPTLEAISVGLILWLICWWMYRRRLFLRI